MQILPEIFSTEKRVTAIIKIALVICLVTPTVSQAADYYVKGRVTNPNGVAVADADITMRSGSFIYHATSSFDGTYSLRIHGVYSTIPGILETGTPYPNPFSYSVNIPFIINSQGDILFSVFSMSGQKIKDLFFKDVNAGSYMVVWDGLNGAGAPVRQGFYVYTITFKGKTLAGRLIKVAGLSSYSSGSALLPGLMPASQPAAADPFRVPLTTTVTRSGYHTTRITDISVSRDTLIDFIIREKDPVPFKTEGDYIAIKQAAGYKPLIIKGINLGASPPGTFPGEIAYAISGDMYEKWIARIAQAGFNCIRIYTLHPPVFYEKLSDYNNHHPEKPLLLLQGIWLDEVEDASLPAESDLIQRIPSFKSGIEEVIDCVHGSRNISFRPGRAFGEYITDISPWIAGYIIGREISSEEVEATDSFHTALTSYSGLLFGISGASASEVFTTRMLDETAAYENNKYGVLRPVSMSSWPTLDPLNHPTEIHTAEDIVSIDINKISGKTENAGLFATYHAYPYYPNFISKEPAYQAYTDNEGPNSYLGYLNYLKNHYHGIPLLIGEFGVPSSWGSAHQSFSKMHHGGFSEQQQGEKNIRMLNNIVDAGCAGGVMFSWMDEWFKRTWIVEYLESDGLRSGDVTIPTRQLWHNVASPEQNFGLLGFRQKEVLPFVSYVTDNPAGHVKKTEATNDNCYFYVNAELDQQFSAGDTLMVAFDTYLSSTGESRLPNGKILLNRSEFLFMIVIGQDTGFHHVTEAYDMNGLTPRFNLSDPVVQKFRSRSTDGAPWKVMQWKNDGHEDMVDNIGRLPVENSVSFTPGLKTAAAWSGNKIRIRIPWTLLYYYDPTQMTVINGAESFDGGWNYEIITTESDGIAVSVYYKGSVTSSTTRYSWDKWLVVPATEFYEKESLHIVEDALVSFPAFAD